MKKNLYVRPLSQLDQRQMILSKGEMVSLAIAERKMIKVQWRQSYTTKDYMEYIFPLHLFDFQGQEYLIWERPTQGNLDCAPIVAMGPIELSSKHFMSEHRPKDIEQFQNEWLYFEDGKAIDPSEKIKRIILKIHTPLLMVDLTPLQKLWTRFVVVGTAENELIVSGNGLVNQELFSKLITLGIKVSFLAPEWAQKKFQELLKKKS